MTKFYPDVIDYGLLAFADDADQLHICSSEPSTYSGVAGVSLGSKSGAAGSLFDAPFDYGGSPPTGRSVTSVAFVNGSVSSNGTATHFAIVDSANSSLLATGAFGTARVVTSGLSFSLAAFTITELFGFGAAAWWLDDSAIDLDFQNDRYHDGILLDSLVASTVLLLHGDGADGSSNISDSTGRHFIIMGGSALIDTGQSKFGGASIENNFTGNLKVTGSLSDFTFGTGDFTIDFWVRFASTSFQYLCEFRGTASDVAISIQVQSNKLILDVANGTVITGTTTLSTGVWYHAAVARSGTSTKMFLDGVQEGSTYTDTNNYIVSSTGPYVGAAYNGAVSMGGWLDEFRVIKGAAAWTANFTPPTMPYNIGVGPYDLLSCSRASVGYSQTAVGVLVPFAANELRITDLGLLVEAATINSLKYSQDLSNAWHNKYFVTIGSTTTAPDGTSTAQKLVADTTSTIYHMIETPATVGVTRKTATIYMKAAGYNYAFFQASPDLGVHRYSILVDLTNGAIIDTATQGSPGTPTTSVEALANGWYRARVTLTNTLGGIDFGPVPTSSAGWSSEARPIFTGDGSSGCYFWGMQIEEDVYPTSYIPTTSATATRAVDDITLINSLGTVLDGSAASLLIDVKINNWKASAFFVGNGAYQYSYIGSSYLSEAYLTSLDSGAAGSIDTILIGNSLTQLTGVKVGFCYDSGGRTLVGGGGSLGTDTDPPTFFTPKKFGYGTGGSPYGYFRRLTTWTSRLADVDLQAYTDPAGPDPTDYAVDLDFQNGDYTVNIRPQFVLTCSRASIGYAQTAAGTLTQFAANQLRITDLGLLVEDARTNICLDNQNISTGNWTINAGSRVINNAVAPDGTTTAGKVTSTGGDTFLQQAWSGFVIGSNSLVFTYSAYVKIAAGSDPWIRIHLGQIVYGGDFYSWFNLSTGAVGNTGDVTLGDFIDSTIEALDDGWFRITLTGRFTTTDSDAKFVQFSGLSASDPNNAGGISATSGNAFYIWGAQVEAGAFASSYIPTATVAATRAVDVVDCTGTLGALLQATPISIMSDVKARIDTNFQILIGQFSPQNWFLYHNAGEDSTVRSVQNGTNILAATSGGPLFSTGTKLGYADDVSSRSLVMGGGTVTTDSNPVDTTGASRVLHNSPTISFFRRLTAWTSRLADATLQGFTAP